MICDIIISCFAVLINHACQKHSLCSGGQRDRGYMSNINTLYLKSKCTKIAFLTLKFLPNCAARMLKMLFGVTIKENGGMPTPL
jgi:hypothetical protein